MIGRNPDGRLKKNVNELQKVRSFNHELVEVREILNVTNPVRHLCVPQKSCYAIVAKKQIERGAILWSYAGQLEKAVPGQAKTTSYVYGVPASKLKAITGGKYAGPDLQIDAESAGNIARFANDTRFRVREREDRVSERFSPCHAMHHDEAVVPKRNGQLTDTLRRPLLALSAWLCG